MPRIIDHSERRELILKEALNIFNELGVKDTTLALIAERSGINRPILYQYFTDKGDIFHYAVKNVTDKMYEDYKQIVAGPAAKEEQLLTILDSLFTTMLNEKSLLGAIVHYYFELCSSGNEKKFKYYAKRRTIKFKRLIYSVLINGEKQGEFVKNASKQLNFLFTIGQTSLLQIALFKTNAEECQNIIRLAIKNIKVN
ncbi:MAG: TetR/AcrR family transcriptional regulator [Spirochaetaceae bacterium]|nr:TetR/AcrR family transcriptional regulator [Spirochaetaceae bacterium]